MGRGVFLDTPFFIPTTLHRARDYEFCLAVAKQFSQDADGKSGC